jgi:hypothetical protein
VIFVLAVGTERRKESNTGEIGTYGIRLLSLGYRMMRRTVRRKTAVSVIKGMIQNGPDERDVKLASIPYDALRTPQVISTSKNTADENGRKRDTFHRKSCVSIYIEPKTTPEHTFSKP